MNKFSGVITALVTPFKGGQVDYSSLKNLVEHQLRNSIEGFVVNGTTAESPNLSWDEVSQLYKTIRDIAGKEFPILLGTGSNSTQKTMELTRKAQDMGADGALVVTPYYNKPTQPGMVQHFTYVADSVDIPVMLYNVPGRTVVSQSVETIIELSKHKNIVGIKEATGEVARVKPLRDSCGNGFTLTSGDDDSCLEFMTLGGDGVISVVSHVIPESLVGLSSKAREKDKAALEEAKKFENIIGLMGIESNPIPVKMALYLMGIIESPEVRLPLVELSTGSKEKLLNELNALGLAK